MWSMATGNTGKATQESRSKKVPENMTATYAMENIQTKATRYSNFKVRKEILLHKLSNLYVHTHTHKKK